MSVMSGGIRDEELVVACAATDLILVVAKPHYILILVEKLTDLPGTKHDDSGPQTASRVDKPLQRGAKI